MKKTLVVFGSTTGTCEDLANRIAEKLGADVINVTDLSADNITAYDNLLLGTSTWGAGELQDDWYDGVETLKGADLTGKTVALFGCGDSAGYGDTFVGGLYPLYEAAQSAGATIVGQVSTDGYTYDDSEAVVDGQFVGLALDEVNEPDQSDARIDAWIAAITPAL